MSGGIEAGFDRLQACIVRVLRRSAHQDGGWCDLIRSDTPISTRIRAHGALGGSVSEWF